MGRDRFPQPRLLPAPSNLALNTPREGAATAPLSTPCQGLTALTGKNFLLISNLNLPSFSPCKNSLSSSLADPSGTGRLL